MERGGSSVPEAEAEPFPFFERPSVPKRWSHYFTAFVLALAAVVFVGDLVTDDPVRRQANDGSYVAAWEEAQEGRVEYSIDDVFAEEDPPFEAALDGSDAGRVLQGRDKPTLVPTSLKVEFAQRMSITSFVTPFACMMVVMYQLRLLLKMALHDMDIQPEYKLRKDPAFKNRDLNQDWSWDFAIVSAVSNEDYVIKDAFIKQNTLQKLLEALTRADLKTCQFKSRKFDKVIIKIRVSLDRLKAQAEKTKKRLRLAESEVKRRLQEGQPHPIAPDEWVVYPRKEGWTYRGKTMHTAIFDTEEQCKFQYYEYMYGEYNSDESYETLYKIYPRSNSIFRGVDRIKLIMSILKMPVAEGGCGLALEQLLAKKAILGAYPLHDRAELRQLQGQWLKYWAWPWRQPFNRIKDYFGEKIGLYFVFLGHYTAAVMVAAVIGLIFYVVVFLTNNPNSSAIPVFCVFMSLWATLFIEFWKRKQQQYAMMWGMVGSEHLEDMRPEFTTNSAVMSINSPITGETVQYYPPAVFARRVLLSYTIILTLSTTVIMVVVVIFIVKAILVTMPNFLNSRKDKGVGGRSGTGVKNWGLTLSACNDDDEGNCRKDNKSLILDISDMLPGLVVAFLNTVQIFAFENFFNELADRLNAYECHRTSTEFADNLTAKVFIFQFINSFTSYLYIAFFKRTQANDRSLQWLRGNYSCTGSCMDELQLQLGSIFITKVIIANTKDILLPYLQWTAKQFQEKRKRELEEYLRATASEDDDEDGADRTADAAERQVNSRLVSPAEEELMLDTYEQDVVILGVFADYRDLVIIYGYTVLFVAAFPLAPMMALINSYVQIRVDGWKLAQCSRRPWPQNAEDIGTWAEIIELMSYFAVFINALIITYTGTFLDQYTLSYRVVCFILLYHSLIFIKYMTALLVEDVSKDVSIQIMRQDFTEAKLISMLQDDVIEIDDSDESDDENNAKPDLTIYDKDDDIVYLDYPGYEDYAVQQQKLCGEVKRKSRRALTIANMLENF